MTRLDDYRSALLAGVSAVSADELVRTLEEGGSGFASLIIDHGLGPLWHARTGRAEFHESRLAAEARYAVQEAALGEIDLLLGSAGIDYVVFKGSATRLLLYDNPANRACHDIDILVRPAQKVQAAAALVEAEFKPVPDPLNIGHEMTLSKGLIDVDLHWGLLREGRLRQDPVNEMLDRRRQAEGVWMLSAEDEFVLLLVHPAFSKHLAARDMGLHRVLDIVTWLRTQSFDSPIVRERLAAQGVRTAGWATLLWTALLATPYSPRKLDVMLAELRPGRLRAAWLDRWLRSNLSQRLASAHLVRLLAFSLLIHDTPRDAVRALSGRRRAKRRQVQDLEAFGELLGE